MHMTQTKEDHSIKILIQIIIMIMYATKEESQSTCDNLSKFFQYSLIKSLNQY